MRSIFWHRRDLRIDDNAGLFHALKNSKEVQPIFIFDSTILNKLHNNDQRVIFIHKAINKLKKEYQKYNADLLVFHGNPIELIPQIVSDFDANKIFINRDYEPSAIARDKKIYNLLKLKSIDFIGSKDRKSVV